MRASGSSHSISGMPGTASRRAGPEAGCGTGRPLGEWLCNCISRRLSGTCGCGRSTLARAGALPGCGSPLPARRASCSRAVPKHSTAGGRAARGRREKPLESRGAWGPGAAAWIHTRGCRHGVIGAFRFRRRRAFAPETCAGPAATICTAWRARRAGISGAVCPSARRGASASCRAGSGFGRRSTGPSAKCVSPTNTRSVRAVAGTVQNLRQQGRIRRPGELRFEESPARNARFSHLAERRTAAWDSRGGASSWRPYWPPAAGPCRGADGTGCGARASRNPRRHPARCG